MKYSLYNTFLRLPEQHAIVFNAMTDSFVAIRNCIDNPHSIPPGQLETDFPVLYSQLADIGAIIPDDRDEVAELTSLIDRVDNDDSILILHVNPCMDCNFHCWYCYESHLKDSFISDGAVTGTIGLVRRKLEGNRNLRHIRLSFFGGEPLLNFTAVTKIINGIVALCRLHEASLNIDFTTNGYLLDKDKVDCLKDLDVSFQITLDGGRGHHDRTRFEKGGAPSYDIILDNVRYALSKGKTVCLRFNYTTANIGSVMEIRSFLDTLPDKDRKYLRIDLQRVWQEKERGIDDTYLEAKSIRNEIRGLGFPVANNRLLNGVRESCYGDKRNNLLINHNGDVFCCTARDFRHENRVGDLQTDGEIRWRVDILERRMHSKFVRESCHGCRIAPLCGGGCRQQAIEREDSGKCMYGYEDPDLDEFILERFEETFINCPVAVSSIITES